MIKVCDSMMGSGKSSAAINYMNDHPDQRFLYITPYVEEAERIAEACAELDFVTPSNKNPQHRFSKLNHTASLLAEGRNIATTHAAFQLYSEEMLENIKRWGYVLICDEAVDVMEESRYNTKDIEMLISMGYVKRNEDGTFSVGDVEYEGEMFSNFFATLRHHNIVPLTDKKSGKTLKAFYWQMPLNALMTFRDVYILTYLFEGQELYYYLALSGARWEHIGVQIIDGKHQFVDGESLLPAYAGNLRELIHVCDKERMNKIGYDKFALSRNWFNTAEEWQTTMLKNHLYNYFHNMMKAKSDDILWTTLDSARTKVRGLGYSNGYISYVQRATNKYKDRTVLAYCINVFGSPVKARYFNQSGLEFDDDKFALSVLIQWIWRSAIRDGKEIWLYLPSRRMREILFNWIDEVEAAYRRQVGAASIIAA